MFNQAEVLERGACTGESPMEGELASEKGISQQLQWLFHCTISKYVIIGDGNLPLYLLFTPFGDF